MKEKAAHEITREEIKKACCDVFDTQVEDFEDKNKSKAVCNARYAYWTILRKTHIMTLEQIAASCGPNFKQTTPNVHQSIKRFKKRVKNNHIIRGLFSKVGEKINAKSIIKEIVEEAENGN